MPTTTEKGWQLVDCIKLMVSGNGGLYETMLDVLDTYDKHGELFAAMMSYWEHHEYSEEMFNKLYEMVAYYIEEQNEGG